MKKFYPKIILITKKAGNKVISHNISLTDDFNVAALFVNAEFDKDISHGGYSFSLKFIKENALCLIHTGDSVY